MIHVVALLAGLVFSAGLALAGMTRPDKVLAFLDPLGSWDPGLMFVMGGAIAVYAVAQQISLRRRAPLFAPEFPRLVAGTIDRRVILGSALFGVGWGVAGLCPAPALASLGTGRPQALLFVLSMLAGMALARALQGDPTCRPNPSSSSTTSAVWPTRRT
jgi:uncharacterized membrane protein YedE/YeeE